MLKYDFNNNNAIVDQPSIWKVGNGKISFITASGTDITDIPDSGEFTIQVGNIDSIHIGGTEHWGYNKNIITLGNAGSVEDDIYVDTITVSPSEADWCKCEKVGNKLVYTPIEANPTTEPRYAYFRHSTSDTYIKSGDNAGLFAAPEWWVTVKQLGSQHAGARPEGLTDNTNPYIGGNGNIGEVEDFTQIHTPGESTSTNNGGGGSSSGGGNSSGNGGSSGNTPSYSGDVNSYTENGDTYYSNVVSITIVNQSGTNAYTTGFMYGGIMYANGNDWAPMYFYIDGRSGFSTGYAKYLIPKGATVVIPAEHIHFRIGENESINNFYGSTSGTNYHKIESWTDNEDVELFPATFGSINFNKGGNITFIITGIDTSQETLTTNPSDTVDLSTKQWSSSSTNNGNSGSGSSSGGNSGSGSSSGGSKNVRITLVNGTQGNVYLEAVHFYITPTLNATDSYTTGNNMCHVRMEYNHTMAFNAGSSMTFDIDATGDIAYLQDSASTWGVPMDGERIYWQNGPSHDGGNPVILYSQYNDNSHWSEDYHANPLSGEIQFNHEYTFTIY